MDPYTVLGISTDADDEAIRQAYLRAVRIHTPERDPKRFRLIARAYESIKSEDARVAWLLKPEEVEMDGPVQLLRAYATDAARQPLDFDSMKTFLRSLA